MRDRGRGSGVGVIEDGDAVAIGHLDGLAGAGVGEGRYGEQDEDAKRNYTGGPIHFRIFGIMDLISPMPLYCVNACYPVAKVVCCCPRQVMDAQSACAIKPPALPTPNNR